MTGVCLDAMLKDGKLEMFKNGPIHWIDSSDSNHCVGKYLKTQNTVS